MTVYVHVFSSQFDQELAAINIAATHGYNPQKWGRCATFKTISYLCTLFSTGLCIF